MSFLCAHIPLNQVHCTTVTGTSMEPTITHNDIVIFTPPTKTLEVGDIISYKHSVEEIEYFFAHRIIDIVDDGYKTKGDSLNYKDNYIVSPEDVTCIMLFKIPFIITIGNFVKTFIGYLIFILIPATILIIKEIKNIKSLEIHT